MEWLATKHRQNEVIQQNISDNCKYDTQNIFVIYTHPIRGVYICSVTGKNKTSHIT